MPGDNSPLAGLITEIVQRHLGDQVPMDYNTDLTTIGLDSISFIQIIVDIEVSLELEWPENELIMDNLYTIERFVHSIHQKSAKHGLNM